MSSCQSTVAESEGSVRGAYLSNHHVAVERAFPHRGLWAADMGPDLCHDWRSKGDIWYEVTIHDVDMEPITPIADCI